MGQCFFSKCSFIELLHKKTDKKINRFKMETDKKGNTPILSVFFINLKISFLWMIRALSNILKAEVL